MGTEYVSGVLEGLKDMLYLGEGPQATGADTVLLFPMQDNCGGDDILHPTLLLP